MADYDITITASNVQEKKPLLAADTLLITIDRGIKAIRVISEGGASVYRHGAAPDATHGSPAAADQYISIVAPPNIPLAGWTIHVDPTDAVTFGVEAVNAAWGSVQLSGGGGSGTIDGSTGSSDNRLTRSDGTGGSTIQDSAVTLDDSGNMSGVAALSATTIELGHASDTTISRTAAGVVAVEGVRLQPVSSTSDPTVNDDSGDGYGVGQMWVNTNTGVARILVDATVGAAVWRSVLPVNALRITGSGGTFYANTGRYIGGAFTAIGPATAPHASGDPNSIGASLSGANLTVPAASAVAGSADAGSQYWSWTLASMGVTIPATARTALVDISVSSMSEGARTASSNTYVGCSLGTAAQTNIRTSSFLRPGAGTNYNLGHNVGAASTWGTASGNSSTTGYRVFSTVGDATSVDASYERFAAGNDVAGSGTISSTGAIVTTIPTHVNIYALVAGANTLETWTLNDFTAIVWW